MLILSAAKNAVEDNIPDYLSDLFYSVENSPFGRCKRRRNIGYFDGSADPVPGMIIFFDWDSDGETDHVGIVQKVENGIVYTVEGNSGDSCRVNQYSIGNHQIYGYGVPQY